MTHPMAERDAVLAAVQELIEAPLSGHGTALFVIGEAGLGKTTVLEHAVALASGRFRTAIGRADIAEAALPFGLIGATFVAAWYARFGAGLPAGAALPAIRSIVYFDGNALAGPLLVLSLWAGIAAVVFGLPRLARSRQQPPATVARAQVSLQGQTR